MQHYAINNQVRNKWQTKTIFMQDKSPVASNTQYVVLCKAAISDSRAARNLNKPTPNKLTTMLDHASKACDANGQKNTAACINMQQHATDRQRQAAVRRKTKTKRTTTSFTQDKFRARHKMTSCRKQRSAVINKHQEWHATSKKQRRTHAMSDRFFAQSPALPKVGGKFARFKNCSTHTHMPGNTPQLIRVGKRNG